MPVFSKVDFSVAFAYSLSLLNVFLSCDYVPAEVTKAFINSPEYLGAPKSIACQVSVSKIMRTSHPVLPIVFYKTIHLLFHCPGVFSAFLPHWKSFVKLTQFGLF